MTGPSIDLATLSTMSAKLDYALALLDTMNKQLDSNEVRIARLEKFQQEKKARAAAAPAAAMVAINRHIDTCCTAFLNNGLRSAGPHAAAGGCGCGWHRSP